MATFTTNSEAISGGYPETRAVLPTWQERFADARPASVSLLVGIVLWEIIGHTAQFAFLPP